MKKMRPTWAMSAKRGKLAGGNMRSLHPWICPSTDGPRRIPPRISPMTLGWWKRLMMRPSTRVATSTSITCHDTGIKKNAKKKTTMPPMAIRHGGHAHAAIYGHSIPG